METQFKRINIALIPPSTVANLASVLSAQIAEGDKTSFVLDNRNYFPHITLYSPEFPKDKENAIAYALDEAAGRLREITCIFNGISSAEDGGIFISLKPNDEIKRICDEIVESLNPIRAGHIKDKYLNEEYQARLVEKQIDYINEYGFWRIKEYFKPHITLSCVKPNERADVIANKIIWQIKEFTCSSIGMFETGEWGTCTRLIKKILLNK